MAEGRPPLPEGWDFDEARRAARSLLGRVEPIGLGTAGSEALSSLVPRVALAHDLPASWLAVHVLAEHLGRARPGDGSADEWGRYFAAIFRRVRGSINGTGRHARSWSAALAEATACPDVVHTTCVPWAAVLPARSLHRRSRAVCPECLEEQRARGGPVYELLLWQFAALEACPAHGCELEEACPSCGLESGVLGSWSVPGRCGRCGRWRGGEGSPYAGDAAWQAFVGEQLGTLVAATPGLASPPSGEGVAARIRRALESTGRTMTGLAAELGVSVGIVSLWCADRRMPSLAASLRICRVTGIPLVELLAGTGNVPRPAAPGPAPRMPETRLIDWAGVGAALAAAAAETPAPALTAVLEPFGAERIEAKRRFPGLCAAVRDRHADEGRRDLEARRAAAREATLAAVAAVHAEGAYPSRGRVAQRLPRGVHARDRRVRQAWRDGLREHGLL